VYSYRSLYLCLSVCAKCQENKVAKKFRPRDLWVGLHFGDDLGPDQGRGFLNRDKGPDEAISKKNLL